MPPSPDPKRRALGKGLESLLPSLKAEAAPPSTGKPLEIPVGLIDRNPFQTRTTFDEAKLTELAQSIAASGVVQPIVVRVLPGDRYQLITGERRLIASKQAGKATIPAIVREVSDEQAMEMTIVENLQRADLNPMEQARAYHRLSHDFKMTQEQMATRTGKDRASVGNFLRLLKLPETIQARVEAGDLSFGHARTLLGLGSPEQIASAAQKVMALSMSVRQTETYIHGLMNPESRPGKLEKQQIAEAGQDPNVHEAQTRLQRSLGLRVKIEDKKGKGKVIIEYANLEDFDALLTALNAQPTE
ncbi:ParB/RepB/Spo0J family partition protein [Granulicella tundricola]|uniref:ParB-like partition protein n=1 Tax=Granulicella tundricola (strain ATCC BAA-1859 / DSM 23138 / MP5ACTX9) TaxID=1198114 RepID=E8WWM7_GRATM|nr:ParB/RepB/Spo0J family partition protein [Granulicella tundricola]ADW70772.1 parB-like partition protein [Granulicella tundricola MP5ACTX9]